MPRGPKGQKRTGDVIGNPNKVAHIATIEVTGEFEGARRPSPEELRTG
jgi:hypothetical protein